ncbi:DUF748 domain-containing protein, partial [Pelomonas sp. KK5]|uniref:DUF748 domain-containing protein n=1 Tax=Pelomonas sp. KK5 TaxID=1855730 RepID=UPI00117F6F9A
LDLGARRIQAGELSLQQPLLQAARAADGRWRHETLFPPAPAAVPAADAPAWHVTAQALSIEQGALRFQDAQAAADTVVRVGQIRLKAQHLAWPPTAEPIAVNLSLSLGRERSTPVQREDGSLQWQGEVLAMAPSLRGKLRVEQLPLQLLDPYLDRAWGLQLRRAELGLQGEFSAAREGEAWRATWNGDASLGRLRLNQASWQDGQRQVGGELLGWQSLALGGVAARLLPGKPPEITVAKAALDDYYMRLNVDEQGRFNIRELGTRAAPAAASAPAPAASGPAALLTVGQIQFSKGEIDFSDHFVKPNYSAHLTELQGSLGAFATGKPAMAPLSLRGKVQGTGDLSVEGQLNPAGAPLTMDVTAKASDIELSPLSPYAAKYAGYAIERGKLSTEVHYKIDPGGQLEASNRITLNQLTFGDKVESPDATTLPVLLAVALLKDSDGVIDLDLPVSGSINDPDFSIGGIVLKLIGNLLAKAVTAPFSLLFGGSGGGEGDASQAAFAPGSAAPGAPEQLDKVAKMLADRPGLALTITGWADAQADGPALAQLQAKAGTEAEQRREARRQQQQQQQRAASPAKKGEAATAPAVSDEQLRQLADQRAAAVRDALIAKGIANSRLFVSSPRVADGAQPHAELSLSTR